MPIFVEASGDFMMVKRNEMKETTQLCPKCAPHMCAHDCEWAGHHQKAVEIPFAPIPSKFRLVLLWGCLLSILGGGIVSVLFFGTSLFSPTLREPPSIFGCGNPFGRDKVELKVQMKGISREGLLRVCPEVRTSMGDGVNMTAEQVTFTNIIDARRAPGEESRANVVEFYVGFDLVAQTPTRRSPAGDMAAAFELMIVSGSFDEALAADWGISVESVYLGVKPEEIPSPNPANEPDQTIAWSCPENAVAPPGATSPDTCTCDPGFYGNAKSCYICPVGFYCPMGSNYRQACPSNGLTELAAFVKTQCICDHGYYGVAGGACTPCEFATYCPGGGARAQCPEYALSVDGSARTSALDCFCMPGYHGQNGEECTACPPGHECPGGVVRLACVAGTYAPALSDACSPCPQTYFSEAAAAECVETPCPEFSDRLYPDLAGTLSGRDLCACTNQTTFYMVDDQLQDGREWVKCKSCLQETCPPGQFNYGCGDACPNSKLPYGECFRCGANTYAEGDATCSFECSGPGRTRCDPCSLRACAAGTFLEACGGASKGVCSACPTHTYAETAEYRTQCTRCGFLDACSLGQVLSNCGFRSLGKCTTCSADTFATTDGTLDSLQFECTQCNSLTCPLGSYRYGCGTTFSAIDSRKPVASSPGYCTPCAGGYYTPEGTAFDLCAECPLQECAGAPGKVYLDGCFASESGECKDISCTKVDTRELCSIAIQPKLVSAIKITGGNNIPKFSPSDSDAVGSGTTWIAGAAFDILAVSAARDPTGDVEGAYWRVGSVYLFQVARVEFATPPPASPLRFAGANDVNVLLRLRSSACDLELANGDEFGYAITSLGDLDGDGMDELAVAAPYRTSPYFNLADAGVVCIVYLRKGTNDDITVKSSTVISTETMGAAETPEVVRLQQHHALFGCAVAAIGDVNDDGVPDLAVSACGVDEGVGAVLILLLSRSGQVVSLTTLSTGSDGRGKLALIIEPLISPQVMAQTRFGLAVAAIGDLNKDGYTELAVTIGGLDAVVLVYLTAGGILKETLALRYTNGTLAKVPTRAISSAADINGDFILDMLIGGNGEVVLLTLNRNGSVSEMKLLATSSDHLFAGLDISGPYFGNSLAITRDRNNDYTLDLAIGAFGQKASSFSSFQGAVYVVHLRPGVGVSIKK